MKQIIPIICLVVTLVFIASCSNQKDDILVSLETNSSEPLVYSEAEAELALNEALTTLGGVKKKLNHALTAFKKVNDVDILMSDIVDLETRMELVKLHASMLPELNKKTLRGELVVAGHQFKNELEEVQKNHDVGGLTGAIEHLKFNFSADSIQ